jgi:hypothetical protein
MPPAPRHGAAAVPDTLCGSGARMVLLGSSSTLYCSRLLTWQERLRTLADIGKWKLGLRFALDFYKWVLTDGAARRGGRDGCRLGGGGCRTGLLEEGMGRRWRTFET